MSHDETREFEAMSAESLGRRDHWDVWEVMHDGEGPCWKKRNIMGVPAPLPCEAATYYAKDLMEEYAKIDDIPIEHGDTCTVAVQVNEDNAVYFQIQVDITPRWKVIGQLHR